MKGNKILLENVVVISKHKDNNNNLIIRGVIQQELYNNNNKIYTEVYILTNDKFAFIQAKDSLTVIGDFINKPGKGIFISNPYEIIKNDDSNRNINSTGLVFVNQTKSNFNIIGDRFKNNLFITGVLISFNNTIYTNIFVNTNYTNSYKTQQQQTISSEQQVNRQTNQNHSTKHKTNANKNKENNIDNLSLNEIVLTEDAINKLIDII